MLKIIINADDCGMNQYVDNEIRSCIEDDIISSTTVMANMDDFDGAVKLYQEFHNSISFGIHFNLAEGHPLLYSQCLVDNGLYVEGDGKYVFFKNFNFYNSLTKAMQIDIEKELEAQAEKILDSGIKPSHIDSHCHVHFQRPLIPIFCRLADKYGQQKIRKEYTFFLHRSIPVVLKDLIRQNIARICCPKLKNVDIFCSGEYFYKIINSRKYNSNKIYELMVHPGNTCNGYNYIKEINMLRENNIRDLLHDNKLMTYYDL